MKIETTEFQQLFVNGAAEQGRSFTRLREAVALQLLESNLPVWRSAPAGRQKGRPGWAASEEGASAAYFVK